MSTTDPVEVATLFDVAATETQAVEDLRNALDRLVSAQGARKALAAIPPSEIRAEVARRHRSRRS